jgi:transposase-like protein/IS1 family transposase
MAEAIRQNPLRFAVTISLGRTKGKLIVTTCHCCQGETKRFGRFQNKNRTVQRYRCLKCGKTFSESQPLAETRIDAQKATQIVHLLCEGMGIRACARLTGVSNPTVLNVLRSAGLHCKALLEAKLVNLKPTHVEVDEIWTFVHKKQYHAVNHPVFGDQYCWLALDEPTKLILHWQIAKRSGEAARTFMRELRSRTTSQPFDITTDAYQPYVDRFGAVFRAFGYSVNYGVEKKSYGTLLQQDGERRYSPLVCTSCQRLVHFGARVTAEITVNHVERQNLNVRLFNRRFTRLTLGFSKKFANLEHSTALSVAFHNFCRPHASLYKKAKDYSPATKTTPAMAAGLTDHVWSIQELLSENLTA